MEDVREENKTVATLAEAGTVGVAAAAAQLGIDEEEVAGVVVYVLMRDGRGTAVGGGSAMPHEAREQEAFMVTMFEIALERVRAAKRGTAPAPPGRRQVREEALNREARRKAKRQGRRRAK